MEEEIKKIIRSLLVSSPLKCTVSKLCSDFAATVGYRIPIREMGYNSPLHFFNSINDVLIVHGSTLNSEVTLVVSEKTQHVNDMVLKQRMPKMKYAVQKRSFVKVPRKSTAPQPSMDVTLPDLGRQYKNLSPFPRPLLTDNPKPLTKNIPKPKVSKYVSPNLKYRQINQANCDIKTYDRPANVKEPETELKFTEAFSGLTISSKVVENERVTNIVKEVTSSLPADVKKSVQDLIAEFPDGLCCSQFQDRYKLRYKRSFNYEEYGYRSLVLMFLDLEDICYCVEETSWDYKIYDRRKPLPDKNMRAKDDERAAKYREKFFNDVKLSAVQTEETWENFQWEDFQYLIPSNVVKLGDEIQQNKIYESWQPNDVIEMVVAEIYDPSKFWFYVNDGQLDKMMDEMQTFYEKNQKKYTVPEYLLEEGLNCVALILREYHRGVIVNLLSTVGGVVKVYFFDYGTVATVSRNEIYFLAVEFNQLPNQAMRGRLANIYPPLEHTMWSHDCTNYLRSLISMKPVRGKISSIKSDEEIIEFYLLNPAISSQKFINDILVEQHYACSVTKKQTKNDPDPCCIPMVKYIHLFPTFFEIENALVPSATDINGLIEQNISADLFCPQYYIRSSEKSLIEDIESQEKAKIGRKKLPELTMADIKKIDFVKQSTEIATAIYGKLSDKIGVEPVEPVMPTDDSVLQNTKRRVLKNVNEFKADSNPFLKANGQVDAYFNERFYFDRNNGSESGSDRTFNKKLLEANNLKSFRDIYDLEFYLSEEDDSTKSTSCAGSWDKYLIKADNDSFSTRNDVEKTPNTSDQNLISFDSPAEGSIKNQVNHNSMVTENSSETYYNLIDMDIEQKSKSPLNDAILEPIIATNENAARISESTQTEIEDMENSQICRPPPGFPAHPLGNVSYQMSNVVPPEAFYNPYSMTYQNFPPVIFLNRYVPYVPAGMFPQISQMFNDMQNQEFNSVSFNYFNTHG